MKKIIRDIENLKSKIALRASTDVLNIEIFSIDFRSADLVFVIDCTINRAGALVILDADSEEIDEILFS